MSEKTFIYRIEKPMRDAHADKRYQIVHIHAAYPHNVYCIAINRVSVLVEDEQIELAISTLKIKLCQEIMSAEFKMVKEES